MHGKSSIILMAKAKLLAQIILLGRATPHSPAAPDNEVPQEQPRARHSQEWRGPEPELRACALFEELVQLLMQRTRDRKPVSY